MTAVIGFLDTLLVPFKLLISSILGVAVNLTGNYGISLVIVSLCITAGTAPLYLLADRWKNDEKRIQIKMARDIASINKHYTGQKKFYLTKTARRIYGYRSWYAIRTSFGLLIQIPFFFAAYEVLSKYAGFKGVPFLFLSDLSMPDGLAMGINVLPFVMTFVNIVSAVYYSGTKSLRDSAELLIMALVFLLLLYSSSSALLVYWTMNNVFSFVKAIIFRRTGLQKKPLVVPKSDAEPFPKRFIRDERGLAVFFFYSLACSLAVFWIVNFKETFKYCMALTTLASVAATIACFLPGKRHLKKAWFFAGWAVLAALFAVFVFFRKYNPYISNPNLKLLIAFVQNSVIAYAFLPRVRNAPSVRSRDRKTDLLSPAVVLVSLVMFVIVYQPLSYYLSSPVDIGVTLPAFLRAVAIVALAVFALGALSYLALSPARRKKIEELTLFSLLVALLWSTPLRLKTGMLDNLSFQNESAITRLHVFFYLLDPFLLTALLAVSRHCLAKKRNLIVAASLCLSSILVFASAAGVIGMNPDKAVREGAASCSLPLGATNNHKFSTTGKNVVFVIADMFNGNYIGRLVEKDPVYAKKLDGFVWYPDCLSVSYNTSTSMPAMFAGRDRIPSLLQGNGQTGLDEIRESAGSFFGSFRDAGFRMTVANPIYFGANDTHGASIEQVYAYVDYWKSKNGYGNEPSDAGKIWLPVLLSVFNSLPWHLKYVVYDDSRWIVFRKSAIFVQMRNKAIMDMAYLATLPEISRTVTEGGGLFLYIHNELPHAQYGIGTDGNPIDMEYPDPTTPGFLNAGAAFLSAKKEIDLLCSWFDWMKENGVYDNTCIVVVSDHGNSFGDNGIPASSIGDPLFAEYDLSRANSLMLVKGYGERGTLTSDPSSISSADIISCIASKTTVRFPSAGIFPPNEKTTRIYSSITGDWESCLEADAVGFRTYEVNGSIFEGRSWKKKE